VTHEFETVEYGRHRRRHRKIEVVRQPAVADDLKIAGKARVSLGGGHESMTLENFEMGHYTYLEVLNDRNVMRIDVKKKIMLEPTSMLDFSNVNYTIFNCTDEANVVEFGRILFKFILQVEGRDVNLKGDIDTFENVKNITRNKTQILVLANNVDIGRFVTIRSGHLVMQANKTITTS